MMSRRLEGCGKEKGKMEDIRVPKKCQNKHQEREA